MIKVLTSKFTNISNINSNDKFWTDTTEKNINKNILQIGQLVYCGLYGGQYGLISHIEGEQTPLTVKNYNGVMSMGGSADIHIIWEDGHTSITPESIVRDVQWTIHEKIDLNKLTLLKELAPLKKENCELKKIKKEKEDAQEQEQLKNSLPFKTQQETGKYGHTHCAINVRIDLKNNFPNKKFSVTANRGANVSSIDVKCDEDIEADVIKLLNKWVEGSFNGMSDSYDYNITNLNKVFGGCRYISVSKFRK